MNIRRDGKTAGYDKTDNAYRVIQSSEPYSEVSSADVLPDTETTILSATVPQGKILYITNVICSGNADASFRVYVGATEIIRQRTSWNQRNANFFWSYGIKVTAGQIYYIKAHQTENVSKEYYAQAHGRLETI